MRQSTSEGHLHLSIHRGMWLHARGRPFYWCRTAATRGVVTDPSLRVRDRVVLPDRLKLTSWPDARWRRRIESPSHCRTVSSTSIVNSIADVRVEQAGRVVTLLRRAHSASATTVVSDDPVNPTDLLQHNSRNSLISCTESLYSDGTLFTVNSIDPAFSVGGGSSFSEGSQSETHQYGNRNDTAESSNQIIDDSDIPAPVQTPFLHTVTVQLVRTNALIHMRTTTIECHQRCTASTSHPQ
ncbi:hypothetical protein BASA60_005485 [Batrachochytrium salamandrivorans]|nr:hypothetical protein BASA60_005485 [Batrachochytrium salamandrivorans]